MRMLLSLTALAALSQAVMLAGPATAQSASDNPAAAAQPSPTSPDALKNRSGLPVPRFASLNTNRAFMRSGPGKQYPVIWEFIRPGTPLEVIAEWNVWRKVRDSEGTEGWMDRAMLGSERTVQITKQVRELRARPDLSSPVVLRAEPGVIMRVTMCSDRWCRIEGEGRAGYLLREQAFGVYPGENIG